MSDFLKTKFLSICPYGKQKLDKMVRDCIQRMLLLIVLSSFLLLTFNSLFSYGTKLYLLESIILAVYLVGVEAPNHYLQKKENKIYEQLLLYFSRVKHYYVARQHIANAVLDASEGMGYEVEQIAYELYHLLLENHRKEKIREYMEDHGSNRFLKLFLIQAYEASENGDTCFLNNVEQIRLELMEELYRRKKRAYLYAGYSFVTVAPFFSLPVLKSWGLGFTPELYYFYAGIGRLLEVLIFALTIIIYGFLANAREIVMFTEGTREQILCFDCFYQTDTVMRIIKSLEKKESAISKFVKQLILRAGEQISYGRLCIQMLLLASVTFLSLAVFFAETHRQERKIVLEQVDNIKELFPVAGEEKKEILASYILEITDLLRRKRQIQREEIVELVRSRVKLNNEHMEQETVKEIERRLAQYKKARGNIVEVIICLTCSLAAGGIPLLRLMFRIKMIQSEAEYEVKQFQSVLMMERKNYGVTILSLLEDMEIFSVCFKGVLRRCINSYSSDSAKALRRMKQEGSKLHAGFEYLADSFLSVDEVGIEKAFEETENNRRLLEKMSQLKAEIEQEKKRDSAELLARIPMLLAIGVYFILPFFVYSLQGVLDVFELMEEMQR